MKNLTGIPLAAIAAALLISGCSNNNSNSSSSAISSGTLLVSRTAYAGTASSVAVGQALPGGGVAIADGGFPEVFENETPDPSFGITSPIFIDKVNTATGAVLSTLSVDATQIVSSFSSKSELAMNQSLDGSAITFMGYKAGINTLDVSNSNTDEAYDQTNPVPSIYQRAVGQLNLSNGALSVTPVNAYSGNNGRAAVLANGYYFMVGNAGNGSADPAGLCQLSANTGVQFIQASIANGGDTYPVGNQVQQYCNTSSTPEGLDAAGIGFQFGFTVSQAQYNGATQLDDKTGKDNNYRGLTLFNNTLYVSKGSGSNGVNTVYQVGAAGSFAHAGIPSNAPITILPGFNTLSEKVAEKKPVTATPHPFGMWFANPTTLFVADEGDGALEGATGKVTHFAGLQQWTLASGTWTLTATYQGGLNINTSTSYASITDPVSATTWHVYTDGLRNITGINNVDGSVTLYATTSTVSDNGNHDLGADPNQIVTITLTAAQLATPASATPATPAFTTVQTAAAGQRLGGVLLVK